MIGLPRGKFYMLSTRNIAGASLQVSGASGRDCTVRHLFICFVAVSFAFHMLYAPSDSETSWSLFLATCGGV
jgi:hypothetical protein